MTGCSIVIAVVVTLFDMTILRATRYKTTEAERGTTSVSAESSSSIITQFFVRWSSQPQPILTRVPLACFTATSIGGSE